MLLFCHAAPVDVSLKGPKGWRMGGLVRRIAGPKERFPYACLGKSRT